MWCPKCGNQVPAGAKFCRNCGARLMPLPAAAQPAPAAPARPGGKKMLAVVVILVVLLALAAAGAWLLLGRKSGSGADCFVVYDGNYMVADMQKDQAFPLVPSVEESADVLFGPDQDYAFLFMGGDALCRVNCAGLELDPEADNIQQVTQVDTGVDPNEVTPLAGGRAVYIKDGGSLCWFDGETVSRLAENVVKYSVLDGERLLYLVETQEGYIVYQVPLDGSEKAVPLTGADEMAWLWSSGEVSGQAAYSVQNQEGWEDLYLVGADGAPQLANSAAQIYDYGETGGTLYYTADTAMPYQDSFAFTGTLCSLQDGTVTQLAERVNNYWFNGDQLVYLVEDDLNQERAAANFSISDVRMDPVCYHCCYVMAEGLPAVEVDMDNLVEVLLQDGDDQPWIEQIMTNGTQVFVQKGEGALYQAPVADGIATGFARMAEECEWMGVSGDTFYYTDALPGGQNGAQAGLYSVRDGENVCLSEDINPQQVWVYQDGTVLAVKGLDTFAATAGGRLVMLDAAGGETLVGEEVTGFLRMDKETVLYLADDTFCRFREGESEELGAPVTGLWCRNALQPVCENDLYQMELSQ